MQQIERSGRTLPLISLANPSYPGSFLLLIADAYSGGTHSLSPKSMKDIKQGGGKPYKKTETVEQMG